METSKFISDGGYAALVGRAGQIRCSELQCDGSVAEGLFVDIIYTEKKSASGGITGSGVGGSGLGTADAVTTSPEADDMHTDEITGVYETQQAHAGSKNGEEHESDEADTDNRRERRSVVSGLRRCMRFAKELVQGWGSCIGQRNAAEERIAKETAEDVLMFRNVVDDVVEKVFDDVTEENAMEEDVVEKYFVEEDVVEEDIVKNNIVKEDVDDVVYKVTLGDIVREHLEEDRDAEFQDALEEFEDDGEVTDAAKTVAAEDVIDDVGDNLLENGTDEDGSGDRDAEKESQRCVPWAVFGKNKRISRESVSSYHTARSWSDFRLWVRDDEYGRGYLAMKARKMGRLLRKGVGIGRPPQWLCLNEERAMMRCEDPTRESVFGIISMGLCHGEMDGCDEAVGVSWVR